MNAGRCGMCEGSADTLVPRSIDSLATRRDRYPDDPHKSSASLDLNIRIYNDIVERFASNFSVRVASVICHARQQVENMICYQIIG